MSRDRATHTFIERLLGRHEWVETSRWYQLWYDVTYRCLVCGVTRSRHEDHRRESLDPRVRAKALEYDRAEADRLRRERGNERG